MNTLITYKIFSDKEDKLKKAARISCNFWNRYIVPERSVVIRLGTFTSKGLVIARAYKPYTSASGVYGAVEFNTKYLDKFDDRDIAGTVIHEICHTLGFGWDKWLRMFSRYSGEFFGSAIKEIPSLQYMTVETDHGPGTQYSHWDEEKFDLELMTGFKDPMEYVLPVTIKVMGLLGHTVIEELPTKTDLGLLIDRADGIVFSRAEDAKSLDRDYWVETDVMEELYD